MYRVFGSLDAARSFARAVFLLARELSVAFMIRSRGMLKGSQHSHDNAA
jgi:hypothetical protein